MCRKMPLVEEGLKGEGERGQREPEEKETVLRKTNRAKNLNVSCGGKKGKAPQGGKLVGSTKSVASKGAQPRNVRKI